MCYVYAPTTLQHSYVYAIDCAVWNCLVCYLDGILLLLVSYIKLSHIAYSDNGLSVPTLHRGSAAVHHVLDWGVTVLFRTRDWIMGYVTSLYDQSLLHRTRHKPNNLCTYGKKWSCFIKTFVNYVPEFNLRST